MLIHIGKKHTLHEDKTANYMLIDYIPDRMISTLLI